MKICVFDFLYNSCLKHFPFLSRTQQDITINVHRSLAKYLSFLSHYNPTWIFLTGFQRSAQISNFITCPVRTELFHAKRQADKWTDTTKLTATFWDFVNMPTSNDTAQHYASLVSVPWSSVTVMKMLTFHWNNQSVHKFHTEHVEGVLLTNYHW